MKIRADAHRLVVSNVLYANRGVIASIPGAVQAKHEVNTYYFPKSPVTAMRLTRIHERLPIESVDDGFNDLLNQMREIISREKYKQIDYNIHARTVSTDNWYTETHPWAHQVTAALFGEDLEATYYAMWMGTGKTLVVINEILSKCRPVAARRFLILCPKSVMDVWPDEFKRHCYPEDLSELDIVVLKKGTTKDKAAQMREYDLWQRKPLVLIANYDSIWRDKLGDWVLNHEWDMVICDEAHRIKSPGGKASRFAARLSRRARVRRCLSGTPLPNNQLDAYGQWRFLDPGVFGTSVARFKARYAQMGGYQGYEIVGWQNQDEFRRLIDYYTFSVDKSVLDLPPTTHTRRYCELPPASRKIYRQIEKEFIAEVGGAEISMTNVLKRFMKLQQVACGFIIDDDERVISLHHEKTKLLQEALEDIGRDQKVVVFCRFRRDLEEVREVCHRAGRRYGELSGEANDLEGGRLKDETEVLGAQIQAGSVGVNLTAARYCVFYSVGYSLADYLQAADRLHRGGQDKPVTYIHLLAEDTMDDRVYDALGAKKEVIDEILAYIKRERK